MIKVTSKIDRHNVMSTQSIALKNVRKNGSSKDDPPTRKRMAHLY